MTTTRLATIAAALVASVFVVACSLGWVMPDRSPVPPIPVTTVDAPSSRPASPAAAPIATRSGHDVAAAIEPSRANALLAGLSGDGTTDAPEGFAPSPRTGAAPQPPAGAVSLPRADLRAPWLDGPRRPPRAPSPLA
jgi:hypothetical protein